MVERVTMRALAKDMKRAALDLQYVMGSDYKGRVVRLGNWRWGHGELPELPPVLRNATPREQRDHRYAEGLRIAQPKQLYDALLTMRQVIAEGVAGEIELRNLYRPEAFDPRAASVGLEAGQNEATKARTRLAERLFAMLGRTIGVAATVAQRVGEVRSQCARQTFETRDAATFMEHVDLTPDMQEDGQREPGDDTRLGAMTATYDVAICANLKPLEGADAHWVENGLKLPAHLDDARVLAAIFRVPRPLVPFTDAQMTSLAKLAFARNWPKTQIVCDALDDMLGEAQPVAAEAGVCIGRLFDAARPCEVFYRIPGGLWAIEPLIGIESDAEEVHNELSIIRRPN